MKGDADLRSWRLPQEGVHETIKQCPIIFANPKFLERVVPKNNLVKNDWMQDKEFFNFFVVGGDWHQDATPFFGERDYQQIADIYEYGLNYEDSNSFMRNVEEVRLGISLKGYNKERMQSISDIRNNYNYYHNLLLSIKSEGYEEAVLSTERRDQVGVVIGKTGEFFHFRTGHHRLAIAKVLNLPKIPIWVHAVHEEWLLRQGEYDPTDEVQCIVDILTRISGEKK